MSLSHSEAGRLGRQAADEALKKFFATKAASYDSDPKRCQTCSQPIPYKKRQNNFCSHSCSAIKNNTGVRRHGKPQELNCEFCEKLFLGNSRRKYCSRNCAVDHSRTNHRSEIEDGVASVSEVRIKAYLLNTHGAVCLDPNCQWNFSLRKISVELHHKDGNAKNNILENVTLLCRNCHGDTENYGARNKGNGRFMRRQRYAAGKST